MRHSILLLLPALALAACSTPREDCIYNANDQLRTLESKIKTAQGNVDRGFAISTSRNTRTVEATCTNTLPDGTVERYPCDRTETFTTSDPVQINIADERRKLAEFKRQLAPLQAATNTAVQQCIAIHPE